MKKFLTTTLIVIMAICLLAGCSNKEEIISKNDLESIPVSKTIKPFDMEEAEIRELYLKLYAEKCNAENFISDDDAAIYEKYNLYIRNREKGFITSYDELHHQPNEYYYPIILSGTEEIVIGYVNEYGCLSTYNLSKDRHEHYSNIHVPENTEYIYYCANYSVVYIGNSVQIWEFGKVIAETTVPTDSVYTGFSDWEGYIFRNGGDVYSVQVKNNNGIPEVLSEAIAHNVKEVIAVDYKLNSDAWSQPLFLMQDGSIKAYCQWNGDENAPRDDKSHLSAPQYEGGYR